MRHTHTFYRTDQRCRPRPLPDHGPSFHLRRHGPHKQQRSARQRNVKPLPLKALYIHIPLFQLQVTNFALSLQQKNSLPHSPDPPHLSLPSQQPSLCTPRAPRVRGKRPQPGHLYSRVRRACPPRQPAHEGQDARLWLLSRHPRRRHCCRHARAAPGRRQGLRGHGRQGAAFCCCCAC